MATTFHKFDLRPSQVVNAQGEILRDKPVLIKCCSQTSSSESSYSKRPQSLSSEAKGFSECGALNLVKHNRRQVPINEECDQTVPEVKSEASKSPDTVKSKNSEVSEFLLY